MLAEELDVAAAATVGPERLAAYDAAVAALRADGCTCLLRYQDDGTRVTAVPLNAALAATCPVPHVVR